LFEKRTKCKMIIKAPNKILDVPVTLPASKSISNRLLIIQALSQSGEITNLSEAEDTVVLQKLLCEMPSTFDVGHAGTAYRFLTAFLSISKGEHILTGSERMKERPISPLVEALRDLGANIEYLEKEGFPPLKIVGQDLIGGKVEIESSTSSQFISALMLIAPKLKNGLEIRLKGDVVSKPYLEMTVALMRSCNAKVDFTGNTIKILSAKYSFVNIEVEYDWSAAGFWYELVVIAKIPHLLLSGVKPKSIQGDSRVMELFKMFGVQSKFDNAGLHLSYSSTEIESARLLDFKETPDLVQPFLAMIAAKNFNMVLSGTRNLQFKETDRLQAMKNELKKFGAEIDIAEDSVLLLKGIDAELKESISIKTYQDHRMAMAFAPLAILRDLELESPEVVEKSYPTFWKEWSKIGFTMVL